jgi:DNA-binding NarL/FixJ family response regulator
MSTPTKTPLPDRSPPCAAVAAVAAVTPPAPAVGFAALTQREAQIVELIAAGAGNKQVAARLCISEWTVGTHLRRIFVKLGVRSRAAMVYRYLVCRGRPGQEGC